MARKPNSDDKPKVNPELSGFDIQINEFGEIISSYDVSQLNSFLDRKVDDKKFRGVEVVKRQDGSSEVSPINRPDGDAPAAADAADLPA